MKPVRLCATTGCDGPTRDTGLVCDDCIRDLERALGDVAALTDKGRHLAVELLTTTARLGRTSDNGGRRSAERPLPFDWTSSDMLWALGNTLSTWARVLLDDDPPTDPVNGTPPAVAAWLLGQLEPIRHHEAAAEIVDEITGCIRSVARAVDRPADRWYAGPCGARIIGDGSEFGRCARELYAVPAAETVRCHACGAEWDVKARRAWLLDAAEDVLAYAELIGQALSALGEDATPAMIRGYVHRGRLVAHGLDLAGRPLYRVGDALELVRDAMARRAKVS